MISAAFCAPVDDWNEVDTLAVAPAASANEVADSAVPAAASSIEFADAQTVANSVVEEAGAKTASTEAASTTEAAPASAVTPVIESNSKAEEKVPTETPAEAPAASITLASSDASTPSVSVVANEADKNTPGPADTLLAAEKSSSVGIKESSSVTDTTSEAQSPATQSDQPDDNKDSVPTDEPTQNPDTEDKPQDSPPAIDETAIPETLVTAEEPASDPVAVEPISTASIEGVVAASPQVAENSEIWALPPTENIPQFFPFEQSAVGSDSVVTPDVSGVDVAGIEQLIHLAKSVIGYKKVSDVMRATKEMVSKAKTIEEKLESSNLAQTDGLFGLKPDGIDPTVAADQISNFVTLFSEEKMTNEDKSHLKDVVTTVSTFFNPLLFPKPGKQTSVLDIGQIADLLGKLAGPEEGDMIRQIGSVMQLLLTPPGNRV